MLITMEEDRGDASAPHGSDLLQGDLPPDLAELAERSESTARRTLIARVKNPLALRFPLFDPDPLLDRLAPFFRPLFSVWGLAVWLAVVIAGLTGVLSPLWLVGGMAWLGHVVIGWGVGDGAKTHRPTPAGGSRLRRVLPRRSAAGTPPEIAA